MPNELLARAMTPPSGAPSEADYQAFCATLSESARGRALLAEYARRNRNADTAALLTAIERIEAHLRADGSAVQRLRDELRMLLIAIRIVRPEIDAAATAAAKAARLAALLDLLERRIDAMAEPAERVPPADQATGSGAMTDEPPQSVRPRLAAVPPSDQPRLPIPPPARFAPRPVSLTAGAPPPAAAEKAAAAPTVPPADPLAAIMALSEDERLALFT